MSDAPGQTTPPGWYPDPGMAGTQRYWDGERWTDHRAPIAPAPAVQEPLSTWKIARGVALGIGSVIAALIVLGQCQAQQSQNDCVIENANRAVDGRPLLNCD